MTQAVDIVNRMMAKDAFSVWLGIEVIKVEPGYAMLKMQVRPDFLNGFGIAHGGITYSLADSALAFASNGHGQIAVSTQTSIAHFVPAKDGDILTAETKELNKSNRLANYLITIHNQNKELIASFNGAVYCTKKEWTE